MNGEQVSIAELLQGLLSKDAVGAAGMIVFPPALYAQFVARKLEGSAIATGVQNIHSAAEGAFTGEISAKMALDIGASYVLVGHSERRQLFGETDKQVREKVVAAQAVGLIPVICVGESLEQREAGDANAVVLGQIEAIVGELGCTVLNNAMLAYEPVWAIGTGHTATPQQAQDMHATIRQWLAGQDADVAENVTILYGGSVKADNAASLFGQPDIDGGLVGGASLNAGEFLKISQALA
jgi:triosephosphate isomerase